MILYFKTTILVIFCLLCAINCNQQTKKNTISTYNLPTQPIVSNATKQLKYKNEIYRLDTLFTKLNKANVFNANVLVAKNNEIIYQKSFGVAIKETNAALTDSSLFQLASVTKVITAIATLILYEQGKLNLNEKVCNLIDSFPYKNVTVKHLLSHRSGLADYTYFCDEYLKGQTKQLSNADIVNLMIKNKPAIYFKENTRFDYNNSNYALLAHIIQKVSGKTYSQFLTSELLIPLGMTHTKCILDLDFTNKNITYGYTNSFLRVVNDRLDGVVGDKGIYTTCYDLFLLSAALYQNKLLLPKTQQMAFEAYSPEKKLGNYGFGWRMKNWNTDEKEIFHNGWWHGYRTAFHRRLKDSLTIIVLSNRLNSSVYQTWRIYNAIDGKNSINEKTEE